MVAALTACAFFLSLCDKSTAFTNYHKYTTIPQTQRPFRDASEIYDGRKIKLCSQTHQGLFMRELGSIRNEKESKVESLELEKEKVPTTMTGALRTFFIGNNYGPILVVVSIAFLSYVRLCKISPMVSLSDGIICACSIVFWWFQEHLLHDKLLHSDFDWMGQTIHQTHHNKPYFHVSIDPPALVLGWLWTVHFLLRSTLPLPWAFSATIGYATAGLFYEWAHYIVHTKVKPSNSFFRKIRDNHIRHHCINEKYWFSFSIPAIDDLMGTNPTVAQARCYLEGNDTE
mmetsp:Transcript_17724/g.26429  ORF Transcript_17724/g.26429 Transcript_17724/m.26429 type:complete len:286 (-) Transcript_17724:492-1349(-)